MSEVQGERKVPVRLTGQSDALCWTWGSHTCPGYHLVLLRLKDRTLLHLQAKSPPRILSFMGQDSSVGIATRYGLDGLGTESRWGLVFPHPSRPALGPPGILYNEYRVFPGSKTAGAWR
jgi:hypothetical protein